VALRTGMDMRPDRPGGGFDACLNGLATIRVRALGGIETLGAFGHSRKLLAGLQQRRDMSVEILEMAIQQINDMVACRLTLAAQFED
jgi:hypothetical protein